MTDHARPAGDIVLGQIAHELAALSEALDSLQRGFRVLLGRPEALFEIGGLDDPHVAAGGACHLRLRLEASDGAVGLLAALRAGNLQLGVIGVEVAHLSQSSWGAGASRSQDAADAKLDAVAPEVGG